MVKQCVLPSLAKYEQTACYLELPAQLTLQSKP
ncbi:Uncharacterised protein [Mycobacteroides abscessus subsp. bolletii]|nr:Uncharacterised protein [Mycobacteroides abscessus subsp. bolletii]